MPVTSVGATSLREPEAAPPSPPSPAATAPAAMPADGAVGHGVTRLKPLPPPYAANAPVFAAAPPPKKETAGAHGAHRGRISIR
jgi:hypothetical protein